MCGNNNHVLSSWMTYHRMCNKRKKVPRVEQELLTLPGHLSSLPNCSGVRVARSLGFCIILCRSLFVLLFSFFWPLYCLSVFGLRILITLLVSSNVLNHLLANNSTNIIKTSIHLSPKLTEHKTFTTYDVRNPGTTLR